MIIIIMGVAGCGKTTVGKLLSQKLDWRFVEGDEFHPPANVEKMSKGIPLQDEDRWPWLQILRSIIEESIHKNENVVVACSALKAAYRNILWGSNKDVRLVYLKGSFEIIEKRIQERKGHFMPSALLKSQFSALEEPQDAIVLDASLEPEKIVEDLRRLIFNYKKHL